MFNNELLRLLIKLFDDLSFNQEIVQNEHKWKLVFFLQDVKTQRFSTTGWLTTVKYNLTVLYYILNTIIFGSKCISVFNFKRDNKK